MILVSGNETVGRFTKGLEPQFSFNAGGSGRFFLPIEKIDRDRRMVWGIAQVEDAPDCQGDVVEFDASVEAFKNWAGNIREMHTAKAVGRCVKIIADKAKKRIYVGVHVSQGAEDTWQKVLDGTLRGFSIGGSVLKSVKEKLKGGKGTFRRIKQYVLDELSLVDSPANAHCLITAVQKRGNALVPLADVLGIVPDNRGGTTVKTTTRKRIADLNEMAKAAIAAGDDVIVIRKSDLEIPTDKTKPFVIKSGASCVQITKDDFSADGYGTDDQAGGPGVEEPDGTEMEPHLTNLAKCHFGMAKAAGMDPDAHYQAATAEDRAPEQPDPAMAAGGGAAAAPAAIAAGRGLTANSIAALVKSAVEAATKPLHDKIADMGTALDAVQKGNTAGTPIERKGGAGTLAAIVKNDSGEQPTGDIQVALAKCRKFYAERTEMLSKQKAGVALSAQEQIRKGAVSTDLDRAVEEFKQIAGRTPTTAELEAAA